MSKKLYIAYGSNLNLKHMKYRCPTAKLVGKGVVENYELQFKGMPHCSYATIAPCVGKSVPVALWELQTRARNGFATIRYRTKSSYHLEVLSNQCSIF